MSETVFFCVALGGATLILIYGGFQIRRKYPRLPKGHGRDDFICEAERERIRAQEVCTDKTHWKKPSTQP